MEHIKHRYSLIIFTFIVIFSFNSVMINSNAQDEEILSLGIRKNVGTTSFDGDKIEGDFTITGSGPDIILNLTLFFNETQVAFESDNELNFRFDTKDYPLGLINITLVGEDSEGNVHDKSISKEFISPTISNWIIAIAIGIALISLGFILVSYLINKKNEKQSVSDKKNKIKISMDKDFQ